MNTVPLSRAGGSTRGFATIDPERQGVFAGSARPAPRIGLIAPSATRAAVPQLSSIGWRVASLPRNSSAPK